MVNVGKEKESEVSKSVCVNMMIKIEKLFEAEKA